MDRHDAAVRSRIMSRIRSRDTQPEMRLRRALWVAGLRGYRLKNRLPGRPDLVFNRHKTCVFIDGCFWHGCPQCAIKKPQSNIDYWWPKLKANSRRDRRARRALRQLGWAVIAVWEHDTVRDLESCVSRVRRALSGRRAPPTSA